MLGSVLAVTIVACTSPAPQPTSQQSAPPREPSESKRIVASIMGEPPGMASTRTNPSLGSVPGMDVIDELVNDGLTHYDGQGNRVPLLAETTPTVSRLRTASSIRPTRTTR
jgi:hypothetical protein